MATQPPAERRDDAGPLRRLLREGGFQIALRDASSGFLLLVGCAALVLLVLVLLDHQVAGGVPRWMLAVLGMTWLLACAVLLVRVVWRAFGKRLSPRFVAQSLEQGTGIRHNALLNAVAIDEVVIRPGLAQAARRQVERVLGDGVELRPPASPVLKRAAVFMVLVSALWAGYAALSSKSVGASVQRLFGAAVAAPTATTIELLSPAENQPVYAGRPLEFVVALRGEHVESATLQVWAPPQAVAPVAGEPILTRALLARSPRADQDPGRHDVTAGQTAETDIRAATLAAHEVWDGAPFRIRAGDAVLDGVLVARPAPEIEHVVVELTPPAYLGLEPRAAQSFAFRAWAGTTARFTARANCAIRDPILVFRGDRELRARMRVAEDGRSAAGSLVLRESGSFWVEFVDEFGTPSVEMPRRTIEVRGDAPPQIKLVTPAPETLVDRMIDLNATAALRLACQDDVALAQVELVYDDAGALRRETVFAPAVESRRSQAVLRIEAGAFPVAEGAVLQVWFEARDNRALGEDLGPQVTRTPTYTLVRMPRPEPEPEAAPAADAELPESGATIERGRGLDPDAERARGVIPPGEGAVVRGGAVDRNATPIEGPAGDVGAPADTGDAPSPAGDGGERVLRPEPDGAGTDAGGSAEPTPQGDSDEGGLRKHLDDLINEFGDELGEIAEAGAGAAEPNAPGGDEAESDDPNEPASEADAAPGDGAEAQPQDVNAPVGEPEARSADSNTPPDDPCAPEADPGEAPADPNAAPAEPNAPEATGEGEPEDDTARDPGQRTDAQQPQGESEAKESSGAEGGAGAERPQVGRQGPSDAEQGGGQGESAAEDVEDPGPDEPGQAAEGAGDAGDSATGDAGSSASGANGQDGESPGGAGQSGSTDSANGSGRNGDQPAGPRAPGEMSTPGEPAAGGAAPPDGPPSDLGDAAPVDSGVPGAIQIAAGAGATPETSAALELLARGDELTLDDLADYDWPIERKEAFLEALERVRIAAERVGAPPAAFAEWLSATRLGEQAVQVGRGGAAGISRAVETDDASAQGDAGVVRPPEEQQVPDDLRELLDAYYESLAGRSGADD